MNWRDFIHSDPDLAAGKPVVRGARLSVDFLLALLAEGWRQEQLLENYPQLTPEALRAVFAFAAETVREGDFYPFEVEFFNAAVASMRPSITGSLRPDAGCLS